MRVSGLDEIQDFMWRLSQANIKIPENLALNLTKEEQEIFVKEYDSRYKFGTGRIFDLNKINTQFGGININTEI